MRPEERMAMAVVLELVREQAALEGDPETCERIRQAVANHGRMMRLEVEKEARIAAFAEAAEVDES